MPQHFGLWFGATGRRLAAFGSVMVLGALGTAAFAQAPAAIPPEHVNWYGDPSAPNISGVWTLVEEPAAKPGAPAASKEGWHAWPAPLQGDFAATWQKRLTDAAAGQRTDDPVIGCMPSGMPRFITGTLGPLLIIQSHNRITLYRDGEGPRRVWADGRPFPQAADLEQFLKGTAIGHYQGSDLLIETRGIKDQPIDSTGVPHSDDLVINERYHRVDKQTLKVDVTLTDPQAYSTPMTTTVTYKLLNDPLWEPHEFICTPKTDYHPDRYVH